MKTSNVNPILSALFSSETRIRVLAHFYLHPGKSYYIRQLESLLGIPVGQFRMELVNLERIGLLVSHREGNQKRFTLNTEFPFHEELKSIFLKTAGLMDILRDCLSKFRGIELAFVFGSYAKGEEVAGSDVDLMIIGDISEKKMSRAASQLEKKLRREVNYSLYDRNEVKKRLDQDDDFIQTVFTEPHMLIIGRETDELFEIAER